MKPKCSYNEVRDRLVDNDRYVRKLRLAYGAFGGNEQRRPEMKRASFPVVKSAARTLAVLELFEELRAPANARHIGEKLRLPISSTSMLLRSMVALGYLSYDQRTRTYLITMRVAALGNWLQQERAAKPLLEIIEELHRSTGQLVAIAQRNGLHSQYIHVVPACYPVPYTVRNGARYPLVRSTAGWALISRCRDDEIMRLVTRSNIEAEIPPVSPRWMLSQVKKVREAGHAFSFGQVNPGAGAVSILLPEHFGPSLALVVGGSGQSFIDHADEYASIMRDCIAMGLRPH
jgi:DNA-binding IclR family transcriptional regulator